MHCFHNEVIASQVGRFDLISMKIRNMSITRFACLYMRMKILKVNLRI